MLKGFWKEHKGQRLFRKLKDLIIEIKLAFERFYLGYDYSEVWNINSYFIARMYHLLNHLVQYRVGHPWDMTREEWINVLTEMRDEFYLADETNFIEYYSKKYDIDMLNDKYDINAYCAEYDQHKKKALELFVQHFDELWD